MTSPAERALAEMFADLAPNAATPLNEANFGPGVPLYQRFMRSLAGNPCGYATSASTGPADVHGLADNSDARQCVIYVAGGDIIYRVDGGTPTPAGDQTVAAKSTIVLTGMPTIKAFQFAAAAAGAVTLFYTFYN